MGARGPKKDPRPDLTFKVEPAVIEALAKLQPSTGMKPEQSASLLLHLVVLEPATAIDKLRAILGAHVRSQAGTVAPLEERRAK